LKALTVFITNTVDGGYERANAWVGMSIGPDRVHQMGGWRPLACVEANEQSGGGWPDGIRYDASNGSVSAGDVYRFSDNSLRIPGSWATP